jgi:hypothetical protein
MEATRSSETSVYIKATRYHFPEYGILHSHRRENLKSSYSVYMKPVIKSIRVLFKIDVRCNVRQHNGRAAPA